jgi:PRC-barrel domain protein
MSETRYLTAGLTRVNNRRLGRLSVRTPDDRELGKLLGFVVDPEGGHISGLVMEVAGSSGSRQFASPLVPMRFDARAHALCLVDHELPRMSEFQPDSMGSIDEDDLWVPFVGSAA